MIPFDNIWRGPDARILAPKIKAHPLGIFPLDFCYKVEQFAAIDKYVDDRETVFELLVMVYPQREYNPVHLTSPFRTPDSKPNRRNTPIGTTYIFVRNKGM
jgi:hypothetical protein